MKKLLILTMIGTLAVMQVSYLSADNKKKDEGKTAYDIPKEQWDFGAQPVEPIKPVKPVEPVDPMKGSKKSGPSKPNAQLIQEYQQAKKDYPAQKAEYETKKAEYDKQKTAYDANMKAYEDKKNKLYAFLKDLRSKHKETANYTILIANTSDQPIKVQFYQQVKMISLADAAKDIGYITLGTLEMAGAVVAGAGAAVGAAATMGLAAPGAEVAGKAGEAAVSSYKEVGKTEATLETFGKGDWETIEPKKSKIFHKLVISVNPQFAIKTAGTGCKGQRIVAGNVNDKIIVVTKADKCSIIDYISMKPEDVGEKKDDKKKK